MTSGPSRLFDDMRLLAVDASVAINLLGTGRAADILRLIGRRFVIEDSARAEVQRNPSNGQPGSQSLGALSQSGLLTYVRLRDSAHASFLALTGAEPPDDLDDGEAATIALAVDTGAVALLDDRKAIRVAQQRHSGLVILQTLDLLSCDALVAAVTSAELADIVYAALQNARMRVPLPFRKWTVGIIGNERAAKCPSLGAV